MKPLVDDTVRAMFTARLFRGIDLIFLGIFFGTVAVTSSWLIFGVFNREILLLVVLFLALIVQAWMIMVLFRVGFFVLQVRADINLMPQEAARIALMQQRGQPVTPAR